MLTTNAARGSEPLSRGSSAAAGCLHCGLVVIFIFSFVFHAIIGRSWIGNLSPG
jgi:hypothetical protein